MRGGDPGIADLHAGYAAGRTTATEVTRRHLARIARLNATLRAFIEVDEPGALRTAVECDARITAGSARALEGIPVGVKANIAVAGLAWSAGMQGRRDEVAQADAVSVSRLRAAGAVILGTLNMHEAAFGATSDNPWFGRAMNPHRAGHTPGGSSGGSGAAVAAGLCVAALGSDTLGSIRIPAAYNGIYGLKPTRDALSSDGLLPLAPALDTIGPLARSLDDLEALTRVLMSVPSDPTGAGGSTGAIDPRRSTGPADPSASSSPAGLSGPSSLSGLSGRSVPSESSRPSEPSDGSEPAATRPALRRLLLLADLTEEPCQPAVLAAYERARAALGALSPVAIKLPYPLARVRLAGFMVAGRALAAQPQIIGARSAGTLSSELTKLLGICAERTDTDLAADREVLAQTEAALRMHLRADGALLLPTTPQSAFAHTARPPSSQAAFTALASSAGLPAISLPAGFDADRLPVGVQLVGPGGSELRLIALARRLDVHLCGYAPPLLD